MRIVLTGGSACGKSSFAESICMRLPTPRVYLAAMRPYGDGSAEKIKKHRAMRDGKGFLTVERYTDYAHLRLPACKTALLECVCNLTANEMFDENGNESDPLDAVLDGIENLQAQCENLIIVTNEVGADLQSYSDSTRHYVEKIGQINRALCKDADAVFELVCGIPILLKGKPLEELL